MKFGHVMLFFGISLPACVLLRVMQLRFAVEENTGFIIQNLSSISAFIMAVIFIAVLMAAVLAYTAKATVKESSGIRPGLSVASLAVSASVIYEFVEVVGATAVNMWYDNLFVVLSLAAALFFIAYSVKNIYDYPFPSLLYIIPALYMLAKLVKMFISISTLALITDNIFIIFGYCAILLFWLYCSKAVNGIETEKSQKKMLCAGLVTVMLCVVSSVPPIVVTAFGGGKFVHAGVTEILFLLFMGLFILVFIIYNFSGVKRERKATSHLAE